MVNYANSSISSFGKKGHKVLDIDTFLAPSTSSLIVSLSNMRAKYKSYKNNLIPHRKIYDIIDRIGNKNLTCFMVESRVLTSKNELNIFLDEKNNDKKPENTVLKVIKLESLSSIPEIPDNLSEISDKPKDEQEQGQEQEKEQFQGQEQ